jgi:V-type H+-transporting ATPase subunit a
MESKFDSLVVDDSPSSKEQDEVGMKKGSVFTKFYRSAPMKHVMIFVQESSAHNLLLHFAALAEGGVMQFDDLNEDMTAFQRRYAPQIKRCDEMERVLGFFETQFKELEVSVPAGNDAAKNFWTRHDAELREYSGVSRNRLIEMERKLLKEEKALRQLNETHEKLNSEFNTCKELKYVRVCVCVTLSVFFHLTPTHHTQ